MEKKKKSTGAHKILLLTRTKQNGIKQNLYKNNHYEESTHTNYYVKKDTVNNKTKTKKKQKIYTYIYISMIHTTENNTLKNSRLVHNDHPL